MSNSSIWPIDRILSGATTPGQSGPGTDVSETVLHIPQSSSITEASLSNCSVSYLRRWLREGSSPSAEMQSVYSTPPADWAAPFTVDCIVMINPLLGESCIFFSLSSQNYWSEDLSETLAATVILCL